MPLFLLPLALRFGAGEARAHATLHGPTPLDGAVLETAPPVIELVGSEPVAPLAYGPERAEGGAEAARAEAAGDGSRLLFVLAEAPSNSGRRLRRRVAPVDGHPVAGRLAFAIATNPALAPAEPEAVSVPLLAARTPNLSTPVLAGGAVIALLLLPLRPAARARSARLARILPSPALPAALFRFAATAPPAVLFAPALVLHVVLAPARLGASAPQALSRGHDRLPTMLAVLAGFSDRALPGVPTPLAIGAVLAMRQMSEGGALVGFLRGRLSLLGLALPGGLPVVATVERSRLVSALSAGDGAARPWLPPLPAFDLSLATGLFAVTAGPGTVPSSRLSAAEAGHGLRVAGAGAVARFEGVPARGLEPAGDRPRAAAVAAARGPAPPGPGERCGRAARSGATPAEHGTFRTEPLLLVPAGSWQLAAGVPLDPFTRVELPGRLSLP